MSNLLSETIQRVLKKGFISNRWQRHSPPEPELSSRRQRECEKEGHIWPLVHLILSLKTEWMILWRWTTRWHFFACGCPPSGQTTARGDGAGTLTLSLFSSSFFPAWLVFSYFPFFDRRTYLTSAPYADSLAPSNSCDRDLPSSRKLDLIKNANFNWVLIFSNVFSIITLMKCLALLSRPRVVCRELSLPTGT